MFIPSTAKLAIAIFLLSSAAALAQSDSVADGKKVFRKCAACHSLESGRNKVGPNLANVIGQKAAGVESYNYSSALERSGIVWTEDNLSKFLEQPSKLVPGTKMLFPGLKTEKDRAAVIAYMKSEAGVSSLAPPAPVAPGAASGVVLAERDPTLPADYTPDVRYTLRTGIAEGRMVYMGVGGAIDGVVNPKLTARMGDVVQINLINGEGAQHDIVFPDQGIGSQQIHGKGASTTVSFRVRTAGDFAYFCSVPGHRAAGMEGEISVSPASAPRPMAEERNISYDPAKVSASVGRRPPEKVRVHLESVELDGKLADGTTYQYWTFNGTVPGPFLRVRVGDTVEVVMKNDPDSAMIHSVDFHAATGPGGGAVHTQVAPGEEKMIEFKALVPGIYVYHCATPMVAHHIANGMYGLILVEPEGGLPRVDREFYVMQGEIYTEAPFGQRGGQEFSVEKMLNEQAEYVVFNGSVGALTAAYPMRAKVGETVRIFFGVGGPNYTSSFHVIGEIFDRAYQFGDVQSAPAQGVQTITVPAGGAAIVDFKLEVPGRYILVDHALSRLERGLVGFLIVEGEENPEVYKAHSPASKGGAH
jgi:nitrite reductase (NO-forming)